MCTWSSTCRVLSWWRKVARLPPPCHYTPAVLTRVMSQKTPSPAFPAKAKSRVLRPNQEASRVIVITLPKWGKELWHLLPPEGSEYSVVPNNHLICFNVVGDCIWSMASILFSKVSTQLGLKQTTNQESLFYSLFTFEGIGGKPISIAM